MLPEKVGKSSRGNCTVVLTICVACCTVSEVEGGTLVSTMVSIDLFAKYVVSGSQRDAVLVISVEPFLANSSVATGSVLPVGGIGFLLCGMILEVPGASRHLCRRFPLHSDSRYLRLEFF